MLRIAAEKAAREMIASGYRHHSYESERYGIHAMLHMDREEFVKLIYSHEMDEMMSSYMEIMAPTRLRGMKNQLVSLATAISRVAIDAGVDVEFSFALSDYYINYQESLEDEKALRALAQGMLLHYYDLIRNEKGKNYSQSVSSAIRFIGRNLYGGCPIGEIAAHVGLEPHYFSAVFKAQTGLSPGRYVLKRKLEEGKKLLYQPGATVTDTAESLGFCDGAHFSRQFKKAFGYPPSALWQKDMPRKPK